MGAMGSNAKPWELDLAEESADQRLPKETDALLTDKDSQRQADTSYYFDFSLGLKPFIANLEEHFGYKLLWLLFAAQFLLKGFANSFTQKAEPYIYKAYQVPAGQSQVFRGVTQLPWAMKPIIGLVSDIFPVWGYNKAPYMLATSLMSVVCFLCVGITSPTTLPITLLVVCFIFMQLQASTADLLSEAKYAERMREVPSHGPALLSYVWFGMQVGGLSLCCFLALSLLAPGPIAST
jgi:hypothetical protein